MPPEVRIHKQNRRSIVMKLTPLGVVVFIPEHLREDSPVVTKFIEKGLAKLGKRAHVPTQAQSTPDALRGQVRAWAAKMNLQPKRVQIRDMYRKWGSCSSAGNITLNTALLNVPPELAEYVVVHELVHLKVFNHGKEFKAMMSRFMPDWQEREAALHRLLDGSPD
jgi:hypothetical protein